MDCKTGRIYEFEDNEEMAEFFKQHENRAVPVEKGILSDSELEKGVVEDDKIRELICKLGNAVGQPRVVRRRLIKQLDKLRKRNTKDV